MSFALGAYREGKERVKGKASRIRSSRIGSALVCVRELKLPKSRQFALITAVMVVVPNEVILAYFPKPYSHKKNPPRAIGYRMYRQPYVLRWARIVRARRGSRVKLVSHIVAE